MQSRPKRTVKASGWYFCIHCYPVLLSEGGWDKDHTWKAVHPENQSASPVREGSPAGCGPCVWQQGQVSHGDIPGITLPSEPHISVCTCACSRSWMHRAAQRNCWAHLQIYCCHWKYTSCTRANCWGTEVKAVLSGKRGSEVGSGAMLVCLEKMGLGWVFSISHIV